jgi:hypothetical protein
MKPTAKPAKKGKTLGAKKLEKKVPLTGHFKGVSQ